MSKAWRSIELAGGGLQAANIVLSRRLKRRALAYALLLASPLGLHRFYLSEPRGAWGYVAVTLVATGLAFAGFEGVAFGALALIVCAALYDAWWIERRLVAINKAIRREVFLSQVAAPPKGFRGRVQELEPAAAPCAEPPSNLKPATRPDPEP